MMVEIVGGLEDGKTITLPDGTRSLKMALPLNLAEWLRQEYIEQTAPMPSPGYIEVELPIQRRGGGFKAIWKEPRR